MFYSFIPLHWVPTRFQLISTVALLHLKGKANGLINCSFIYLLFFSKHCMLVRLAASLKPVPGNIWNEVRIHPGWSADPSKKHAHTFTHTFRPRGNLMQPGHFLKWFWEVGENQTTSNTEPVTSLNLSSDLQWPCIFHLFCFLLYYRAFFPDSA